MPTISIFYGIMIQMFWKDHAPPHFHARYGQYKVAINIQTLEIMKGKMPSMALNLNTEWALRTRQALLEDWELCQRNQVPQKIAPLK